MNTHTIKNAFILTLLLATAGFSFAQWTGPTSTPPAGNPNLPVLIQAVPSTIVSGQSALLIWPNNVTATDCDASWIAGANNGTGITSTVSPTQTTTYTINCDGPNGTSGTSSTTVTVGNSPSVTLAARNTTQNVGGPTANVLGGTPIVLNWNATGTGNISCVASGTGFTGSIANSGIQNVATSANTYAQRTYTVTCTNQYGTGSASVTVNVWKLTFNANATYGVGHCHINGLSASSSAPANATVPALQASQSGINSNINWASPTNQVVGGISTSVRAATGNALNILVGNLDYDNATFTATASLSGQTTTATDTIIADANQPGWPDPDGNGTPCAQ